VTASLTRPNQVDSHEPEPVVTVQRDLALLLCFASPKFSGKGFVCTFEQPEDTVAITVPPIDSFPALGGASGYFLKWAEVAAARICTSVQDERKAFSVKCVLVKRDPLQVWMAERVRELAQQEFSLRVQDGVDSRCIRFPTV
jgi:hypothetical protein